MVAQSVANVAERRRHKAPSLLGRSALLPRGHSTAGDAGRAAKAAGVGRLVLTHLPGEALAEPMLAEARAAFGGPVEVAHDLALLELT